MADKGRSVRSGVLAATVAALVGLWAGPAAAGVPMTLATRWPCAPASVYVDPAAPDDVVHAVEQWHRAFRPDWTFTTSPAAATVRLLMQRPPMVADAGGLAVIAGTATTRVAATVYVEPGWLAGDVARHELGHVAGLEHTDNQWDAMGAYTLVHRYSANELGAMAAARRLCLLSPS